MATLLTKTVNREVTIETSPGHFETFIISLDPANEIERFPTIKFRKKGKRFRYSTPVQSHYYHAARKHSEWTQRERKRMRKERRELKAKGVL